MYKIDLPKPNDYKTKTFSKNLLTLTIFFSRFIHEIKNYLEKENNSD